MAELPTYHTKEEKKALHTNCTFSDSENDVREWLSHLDTGRFDNSGMALRGLSNASYKLYSSLQRNWIQRNLASQHKDSKALVQRILDVAFHHGVRGTLLDNGERDELAMLSYLQHHDCPTPFLDFTSDIRVALFFASQEPKGTANGSALDEYFSIYIFHPEIVDAVNSGLSKAWREYSSGQREGAARWFRSHEMNAEQDTLIFEPHWIRRTYGDGVVNLDTSERFRRQSGLFSMNNTADLPFPEAIHAFVDARTNDERERLSVRTWVNSLNIHRKHAWIVREWLDRQYPPMTESHLLPVREKEVWVTSLLDRIVGARVKGSE